MRARSGAPLSTTSVPTCPGTTLDSVTDVSAGRACADGEVELPVANDPHSARQRHERPTAELEGAGDVRRADARNDHPSGPLQGGRPPGTLARQMNEEGAAAGWVSSRGLERESSRSECRRARRGRPWRRPCKQRGAVDVNGPLRERQRLRAILQPGTRRHRLAVRHGVLICAAAAAMLAVVGGLRVDAAGPQRADVMLDSSSAEPPAPVSLQPPRITPARETPQRTWG